MMADYAPFTNAGQNTIPLRYDSGATTFIIITGRYDERWELLTP